MSDWASIASANLFWPQYESSLLRYMNIKVPCYHLHYVVLEWEYIMVRLIQKICAMVMQVQFCFKFSNPCRICTFQHMSSKLAIY